MSKNDKSHGSDPQMVELPSITIEGKTYTMRRLGIGDCFALVRLCGAAVYEAIKQFSMVRASTKSMEEAGVVAFFHLMANIAGKEEAFYALIGGTFGLKTPKDMGDPNKFPLPAWTDIAQAIAKHPDLEAFVKNLERLRDDPATQRLLKTN